MPHFDHATRPMPDAKARARLTTSPPPVTTARRRAGGPTALRRAGALLLALAVATGILTTPVTPAAAQDTTERDAFEGGFTPPARRVIIPSVQVGLAKERPIPVGVTCSCTIDRTGVVSQFDLTVIQVVQDALPMVQQLNRFNRPPRAGARYLAAYVGQQYVAGPENQAYTTTESDWKAMATDERLSDAAQLLHTELEYRPRADVYPGNYVNGWLIFELPVNRPAFLVWNYAFVGERGIWFALQ